MHYEWTVINKKWIIVNDEGISQAKKWMIVTSKCITIHFKCITEHLKWAIFEKECASRMVWSEYRPVLCGGKGTMRPAVQCHPQPVQCAPQPVQCAPQRWKPRSVCNDAICTRPISIPRYENRTSTNAVAGVDTLEKRTPAESIFYATFDHPLLKLVGQDRVLQIRRESIPPKKNHDKQPEYAFFE